MGEPWIKTQIDEGFTVESQDKNERSVLNFYRKLFSIRNTDPCLKNGEFELLMNENDVSVYTRTSNDSVVYVISNFSSEERSLPDCVPTNAEVLLNNYEEIGNILKPYQSFWLKK